MERLTFDDDFFFELKLCGLVVRFTVVISDTRSSLFVGNIKLHIMYTDTHDNITTKANAPAECVNAMSSVISHNIVLKITPY